MSELLQSFINSIRNFLIRKQNINTNDFEKNQLEIKKDDNKENLIESPHFIVERIIDSNLRIGIGSLYINGEGIEILNFYDDYLELIDFSKNIKNNNDELEYLFANHNKNLNYKLIITKQNKLPQYKKLLEYKLINIKSMDVIVSGTIAKITVKNIGMEISKNIDEIEKLF
jgi:hypothetical protein